MGNKNSGLRRVSYSGERFGLITILHDAPDRVSDKGFTARYVVGRCDCGCERTFSLYPLLRGKTRSCGCHNRRTSSEGLRERRADGTTDNTRHGHARSGAHSSLYRRWALMKRRCESPSDPAWKHYGGRGISVCERWHLFENFLADMGEPPPGLTLDRIDNDGNYEPGNCRWATWKEQMNNQRRNKKAA